MTSEHALRLDGLRRHFTTPAGTMTAVDGIDLSIERGEIVALLGPNGAGKTTTLDMVLGLVEPSEGTVEVLGMRPRDAVNAGRISAVLQSGGLLDDITVRETVTVIAAMFDQHADVDDVLARVRLTGIADRKVSKCSGGEQQRLRFALALLPVPDLLVLDEPTAGMDVTARRTFWATMHAEAEAGRTIVFATHYLEEADDFADRIVLMQNGRIVADGSTDEIRARATGRVVSAHVSTPDQVGAHLRAAGHSVSIDGPRIVIRSNDSDGAARYLLTATDATELEIATGTLDDAFLAITGDDDTHPSTPALEGSHR